MSRDNDLPFARGQTYCNGDSTLISNLTGELEGKVYMVKDDAAGGTNQPTFLIVLKNNSGSSLANKGGFGVAFSTGYIKRRASGLVSTNGLGVIVDPAYSTTTIASGDLFYAVIQGYVEDACIGASVTAGDPLAFDSTGRLVPVNSSGTASAGRFIVGYCDLTATYSSGGAEEVTNVHVGLSCTDFT